ncbi:hypothetical protein B0T18DRAFT_138668 [Schizothecium vesticola]|uniref:Uncharacterized protein n=1 Tax=Schizothecium vesticola TaxID=314040 RepID=A0AA40K4R5_9PEZI|nr:hypothetical protein B0T18DRAFT_138668 [Schizothecium vesticola]
MWLRRHQETQPPSLASRRRSHPSFSLPRLLFFGAIFSHLSKFKPQSCIDRCDAHSLEFQNRPLGDVSPPNRGLEQRPCRQLSFDLSSWSRPSTNRCPWSPFPGLLRLLLLGPPPDSSPRRPRPSTSTRLPFFQHIHSFDDFQKQAAEFAVAIPYLVQQIGFPLYSRTKNQTLPSASYFSLLSSGDHTRRTTSERSKMEV